MEELLIFPIAAVLVAVLIGSPILTLVLRARVRRLEDEVSRLRFEQLRTPAARRAATPPPPRRGGHPEEPQTTKPDASEPSNADIWLAETTTDTKSIADHAEKSGSIWDEENPDEVARLSRLSRRTPDTRDTKSAIKPTETATPGDESDESSSLEEQLAGKWLTWVGAIAVIIGAGFFFKYTIDADLIGPTGRVVLGILTGIVALAGAAYGMLRDYRFFAHGLAGAGVGILYFSLFAAFDWYHLMPQPAAFAGMILVTCAALAFSVYFEAQSTAVLGLLGGFLTPIMLSTGVDRQWALFSYILLLDLGVLGIATFRRWQFLKIVSLVGTLIIWLSWFEEFYVADKLSSTVILMTAYFLVFALLGIWHNVVRRQLPCPADFVLILATPVLYFIGLYAITVELYDDLHGVMALSLAGTYVVLGALAHLRYPAGRAIVISLGGIAASFLTVAIPLQFTGHWIAITWAAESLLLVKLGLKFREQRLRTTGFVLLAFVQCILLWYSVATFSQPGRFQTRFSRVDPVAARTAPANTLSNVLRTGRRPANEPPTWTSVFNGRSFSFLASAIVMGVLAWEYRRRLAIGDLESDDPIEISQPSAQAGDDSPTDSSPQPSEDTAGWLLAGAPLTILGMLLVETYALAHSYHWITPTLIGVHCVSTAVIAMALMALSTTWGPRWLDRVSIAAFGLLSLFVAGNTIVTLGGWRADWRRLVASGFEHSVWNWLFVNPRGLGLLCSIAAAIAAALLIRRADLTSESAAQTDLPDRSQRPGLGDPLPLASLLGVFAHLTGLALLTIEVYAQGIIHEWDTATSLAITGVWTLYSIATLVAGIYYRAATVRVLALLLFLLTTGKVFLYDVWHLDKAIRTVAFVGLGISLLLVSYLYRRYRDRIRAWIAPPDDS